MSISPKQRMLNAYRGIFSDRYPVAPEFWSYYPAKVLGVDMIQFEREVPHWQALQATFKKYGTDGWGIAAVDSQNPLIETTSSFDKIADHQYRETAVTRIGQNEFTSSRIFDLAEPSWTAEYSVKKETDLPDVVDAYLSPQTVFDFTQARQAFEAVGEDYLLELCLGAPFFDFIAEFMGFEKSIFYFLAQDPAILEVVQKKYIEFQLELVRQACQETRFESFFIGCGASCNSLLGPTLWRQWDKPYIKAIADELHRQGRMLHIHFHGKCLETVEDFAELEVDCICPFERPPGGDIAGRAGLEKVRNLLNGKVTMNGNVHTVETLIRGTAEDVRREVNEIKETFAGTPRLIIGTGDQVGKETPEENIQAMVQTANA